MKSGLKQEETIKEKDPLSNVNIYDTKLHEIKVIEDGAFFTTVMTVHAGWIYRSYDKSHGLLSSVFVPRVV
jgi:hypothetical protein